MVEGDGLRRRNVREREAGGDDATGQEFAKREEEREEDIFEEPDSTLPAGTYWLTRVLFLRSLGFVYFIAFLVALHQNEALIGSNGILPVKNHLKLYERHFKGSLWKRVYHCPTILWLLDHEQLDFWINAIAYVGIVLSLIVCIFGAANMFIMLALWMLYHSITNVGQTWYGFGWESQLLETGFLAIFFCPLFRVSPFPKHSPPSFIVINGYRWLICRIMLGAGLIKIRGDKCWRDLTCMDYHYETQPVPNPVSYYLHQSPAYIHKFETAGNHIVELFIPFFLFWPRKPRIWAGIVQIVFQIILIISGNLSFLNWLTILPSICCFDDSSLMWLFSEKSRNDVLKILHFREVETRRKILPNFGSKFRSLVNFLLFCLIAYLSFPVVVNLLSQRQSMNRSFDPLRIVNTYGAFGSITKTRTEVIIQGTYSDNPNSPDARWLDYEFKCKPGNVTRRPCLITPYHYRLDWLMWFAAFQNAEGNPWFIQLISKLLQNDIKVTALIDKNPFEGKKPPKYIRAEHFKYKYTKFDSLGAQAGKWWKRKRIGTYLQPVNLKMLKSYLTSWGFDVPRLT